MAEQRDLVGKRHLAWQEVIRMDVDVPQSGHQAGALEVDLRCVADARLAAVGSNLADSSVFDQKRCAGNGFGTDAVDQGRIGKQSTHERASQQRSWLAPEIKSSPHFVIEVSGIAEIVWL